MLTERIARLRKIKTVNDLGKGWRHTSITCVKGKMKRGWFYVNNEQLVFECYQYPHVVLIGKEA